jgi:hypothetical protein
MGSGLVLASRGREKVGHNGVIVWRDVSPRRLRPPHHTHTHIPLSMGTLAAPCRQFGGYGSVWLAGGSKGVLR